MERLSALEDIARLKAAIELPVIRRADLQGRQAMDYERRWVTTHRYLGKGSSRKQRRSALASIPRAQDEWLHLVTGCVDSSR